MKMKMAILICLFSLFSFTFQGVAADSNSEWMITQNGVSYHLGVYNTSFAGNGLIKPIYKSSIIFEFYNWYGEGYILFEFTLHNKLLGTSKKVYTAYYCKEGYNMIHGLYNTIGYNGDLSEHIDLAYCDSIKKIVSMEK